MKKFRSKSGTTVRLALLDGHVTLVGSEWQDLHERFHSAAYSAGCVSDDMVVSEERERNPKVYSNLEARAMKKDKIKERIARWIEDNRIDNFNKQGKPDAAKLKAALGETVSNSERDEAWYEMLEDGFTIPVIDDELITDLDDVSAG